LEMLTSFKEMVGKTIADVTECDCNSEVVITFEFGSFVVLTPVDEGYYDERDLQIKVELSPADDVLEEGGVISEEECNRRMKERNAKSSAKSEQRDRDTLARLKARYEDE